MNETMIVTIALFAGGLAAAWIVYRLLDRAESSIRTGHNKKRAERYVRKQQQQAVNALCPRCGKPMTVEEEFCQHCGTHR
jgi:hypothetical protein